MAEANGPRKDEFYVLANALWFEKVRCETGIKTSYLLGKFFEPKTYRKNANGDPFHNNKWSKYAAGLSRPNPSLVSLVEQSAPGTAKLLKHPLWEILRNRGFTLSDKVDWIQRLDSDVQRVLLARHSSSKSKVSISAVKLQMLERRADLDALAALSILMLEANRSGHTKEALDIGEYVYRVLLITCFFQPYRKFSWFFFDCFQRRIFAHIAHQGLRIFLPLVDNELSLELLSLAVRQVKNIRHVELAGTATIHTLIGLLMGRFGFDVRYALGMPIVLDNEWVGVTDEVKERVTRFECLREWGVCTLLDGKVGKFPPLDL